MMGKTLQHRSPAWGKQTFPPAAIAASLFCLALLIASTAPLARGAEPATGLVISRDGANVNVSLDSEASASVSIRRSDDVMMIRLPKSFGPKLVIDPALKKDSVVEESETSEGRVITISSQQIYLMTKENLEAPASVSHRTESGMQPAVVSNFPKKGDIKPVSLNSKNPGESGKGKSAEKPAVLGGPMGASKISPALAEAIEKLKRETESSLSLESSSADRGAERPESDNPAPKADSEKISKTQKTPDKPGDPEAQPLDLSGQQQTVAMQSSTGSLMRIAFSLLAVLALFSAFAKLVLPRLMGRYPDFFENLQRQDGERRRGPAFQKPAGPKTESKKTYLERLNVNGDRFNVLTSMPLGKGKELHLVEIRGRQFVVATTPYTVSLLQDLTNAVDGAGPDVAMYDSEPLDGEFEEVYQPRPALIGMMGAEAAEPDEEVGSPYASPKQISPMSETVAYLSDEMPSAPAIKANPYASRPEPKIDQRTPVAPPPASLDQTYLKYLDAPVTVTPQSVTPTQASQPVDPPSEEAYVEAEEVVVLQDYDDTFGE